MVRVLTNGTGDEGSMLGRVIPKTQKMILDAVLHNTQHYHIYLTPPLEQNMTQAQFLSGV